MQWQNVVFKPNAWEKGNTGLRFNAAAYVTFAWLASTKMPEWNGMEDFKNGMEDNLPYFHTNSILHFAQGIYRKIYMDSDKKKIIIKQFINPLR